MIIIFINNKIIQHINILKNMSASDNDENGKPYPKDSVEIKEEEDIPKESINNKSQQFKEEQQNNEINDNFQNNEEDNNFPDEQNNENDDNFKNNEENNNFPEGQKNENDDNFPNPGNDDFDNYINENNKNEKKEDINDDYNQDNTFKDDNENIEKLDNNNNSQFNNNETFRISNTNDKDNNQNNRYTGGMSNISNNENKFEYNNNNYNNNQNNEENNNNGLENNNPNNNINRNSDSFGFRDSDLKDNNINNNENNEDKDMRNSGNSDHLEINKINNNKEDNNENKNSLRNKPKNNFNNSKNNNFNNISNNNNFNNYNYARNPYPSNSNTNYNNNNNYNYNNNGGGFGMGSYNNNINQTATNFIPQDTHVVNNLNYNYSSNYNNTDNKHHPDYDPQYEDYEELPEDSDGFHIDPNKKGKDSSTIAGIQIANTIMGAGILSIPIIMNYLGILLGTIIVFFLAMSTIYSVNILIRCHEITGKNGYSMFGKITMGKFGSILIKIIIIINNMGICICYFRIFGEVLQTIVQTFVSPTSYWATNWHNYIYILFGSVLMFSFIFIKNISSLKRVSYLGVIAVLIFTISLCILLFYKSVSNKLDSDIGWDFFLPDCTFTEAFHSTPTVFLAFLFQFNVFPIYYSMKHRSMSSMMRATKIGVGYSLAMFLIAGIIGFLLYGSYIEDTILDNLNTDMVTYRNSNVLIIVLIIIICVSFIITCLTSFPILFLSLKVNYVNALTVCIKSCKKTDEVQISQGNYEKKKTFISKRALIFIEIMLYAFIVIFAIVIYKLKTMFTIIGASAGSFIGFILPNVFYIIIVKQSNKNYNLVLPFIFLFLGIFFFLIAILLAFF